MASDTVVSFLRACSRTRTWALVGSLAAALLLVTAIGYGVAMTGYPLAGEAPSAGSAAGFGSVQAQDLVPSLAGSLPVVAVISPPDTQGFANSMNASNPAPHGKGQGNTAPIAATLPTGSKQYATGIGWDGISGANSSCFQPVFGMNSSPLACLPPDVTMSASANFVMEESNTAASIWTSSGQFVKFFTLTNFYMAPSGAGCYLTDPQVYFDNQTQRWFTSILSVTCGALNTQGPDISSQIYLGVSQTSDPSGSWFEYVVPNQLAFNLSDQPFLGVNDNVVVLSTNQFPDSALVVNGYTGAYFWVLDKLALEQVGCTNPGGLFCSVTYQAYGPYPDLASIHPAHSYGPAPIEYMASVNALSPGQTGVSSLSLFAVAGTPPSATVTSTSLAIQPMEGPPLGNEPGMPQFVNTDDSRITTGVYQAGVTWWGANDGCTVSGEAGVHDCIRLIEITTSKGKYQVKQDFDFNSGNTEDDYYPGITVTPAGDLAVTYAFSSPSEYPSMAVTLRLASDKAGLEPGTVVAIGQDNEQGGRYGDFCDASPSYSNPTQVWLACEYILNYNDWVWNTHVEQLFVTG